MTLWRPIPGCLGYEASDTGEIRSTWLRVRQRSGTYRLHRGRVLRPRGPCGRRIHCIVSIRQETRYVHDLVALAFVGPRPPGSLVMHLDDNPLNNTPANLSYGSKSENELAKHRTPVVIGDDEAF